MKLMIGVGGRFHADQMAKALLSHYDLTLHTTYPASRFPEIPKTKVHSHFISEIIYRGFKAMGREILGEHAKMLSFGRSLAMELETSLNPDAVIVWSSFALESFHAFRTRQKILVRDSAHILFQSEVLSSEYERLGFSYPDKTIGIQRELQEYALADKIFLLSNFAKQTFVKFGVSPSKLSVIRLGVNTALFQPRAEREFKLPLNLVYFGAITLQKGVPYLFDAVRKLPSSALKVTLIGSLSPEVEKLLKDVRVEVKSPMNHERLSEFLRTQDVFVFPTIHDGFGQTLIQAMASGLVCVSTNHCGASELIQHGVNGFVVKARSSERIQSALEYLIEHLTELPSISKNAALVRNKYTWDAYSRELRNELQVALGTEATRHANSR